LPPPLIRLIVELCVAWRPLRTHEDWLKWTGEPEEHEWDAVGWTVCDQRVGFWLIWTGEDSAGGNGWNIIDYGNTGQSKQRVCHFDHDELVDFFTPDVRKYCLALRECVDKLQPNAHFSCFQREQLDHFQKRLLAAEVTCANLNGSVV